MRYILTLVLLVACCAVLPFVQSADESLSKIAHAITVIGRIEALETRVSELESQIGFKAAPKTVAQVTPETATKVIPKTTAKIAPKPQVAKPLLEIDVEGWCEDSRTLQSDIWQYPLRKLPVEVREEDFSGSVPALRWTDRNGKTVTRVGYKQGELQSILDEILN